MQDLRQKKTKLKKIYIQWRAAMKYPTEASCTKPAAPKKAL